MAARMNGVELVSPLDNVAANCAPGAVVVANVTAWDTPSALVAGDTIVGE